MKPVRLALVAVLLAPLAPPIAAPAPVESVGLIPPLVLTAARDADPKAIAPREMPRASRSEPRRAPSAAPAAPSPKPRLDAPTAAQWAALRKCESGGSYTITNPSGKYRGAYQFDLRTWASYGPPGDPAAASPAEQDRRALALWHARGWAPWPICGKRAALA